MLRMDDGNARRERAADRTGNGGLAFEIAVGTEREAHVRPEILARLPGDVLDRAADRVLAVERALRAAKNFEALDVEKVELRSADAREIDVVDIDADRRIEGLEGVGLADAADVDVGGVGGAAALHDVEVRNRALQAGR